MADEPKGKLQFNQVGQSGAASQSQEPVNQANGGGETEQREEPKYITVDDFEKSIDALADKLARQIQSRSDKNQAQIKKVIDALAKQGITATPEVANAVLNATPEFSEPSAEPSKPTPAQEKVKGGEDAPHPIVLAAYQFISKSGLDADRDFTDDDAKYFDAAVDEVDFMARVKERTTEKLAKRGTQSRTAAANVANIGAGSGQQLTEARIIELLDVELKKPSKNLQEIKRLRGLLSKG